MIFYLKGKLASKKPTEAIIDIQGIGYQVFIPTSTFQGLPNVGEQVQLHTYHHVREDAQVLFGFLTESDRLVFSTMLSVSGIGPKLGLAVLSALSASELQSYILNGDDSMLTRIPGVGTKTAQRMIIELKDKIGGIGLSSTMQSSSNEVLGQVRADALSALEELGLSRAVAERKIRTVLKNNPGIQSVEELIRQALRN